MWIKLGLIRIILRPKGTKCGVAFVSKKKGIRFKKKKSMKKNSIVEVAVIATPHFDLGRRR